MKHLQLFESFKSREITSITNFIKNIIRYGDTSSKEYFIQSLCDIAIYNDTPLSNFEGEYMRAKSAISINSKEDTIIKFWFSLESGYILSTINNNKDDNKVYDFKFDEKDKLFLDNNLLYDKHFNREQWSRSHYVYAYKENDKDFDYAFVINLSKIEKGGLSSLIKSRAENKPLARIDDAFYKSQNRIRYNNKDQSKVVDLYNKLYIVKSNNNTNMVEVLDNLERLYKRGTIGINYFIKLLDALSTIDLKYGNIFKR